MTADIEDVLQDWFGELDDDGRASAERRQRWWTKSEATDAELRERFFALHAAISAGEREDWLDSARGALAYVVVLDQLSRNMFRGTPTMYREDGRALAAAERAVEEGFDRALRCSERAFLYMPFMHSESIAHQDRCVELFRAMAEDSHGPTAELGKGNVGYAEKHRVIVARFGRFPHRNALLGRASTDEELEFLKEPGSSF